MFKIAVIADPYLQVLMRDNLERDRLRAEFMKFPPADMFMTAVSKPLSWVIPYLWRNTSGYNQSPNTVHINADYHNSIIMSYKLETSKYDKKTRSYITTPVPGRDMINTKDGLVNTNAENDAVIRMLDSKLHKPDLVVLLDCRQSLSQPVFIKQDIHSNVIFRGLIETQQRNLPYVVIV